MIAPLKNGTDLSKRDEPHALGRHQRPSAEKLQAFGMDDDGRRLLYWFNQCSEISCGGIPRESRRTYAVNRPCQHRRSQEMTHDTTDDSPIGEPLATTDLELEQRSASRVEPETGAEERLEEESPERSPHPPRNPGRETGNHGTAPGQQSRPGRWLAGGAFFYYYYWFHTGISNGNTPHGSGSARRNQRAVPKKGGGWWQ